MAHARQLIRQAIVSALQAAGTSAGSRVYDSPNDARNVFPAIVVSDGPETQRAATLGGRDRTIERLFRVDVAAEVQQTGGYAAMRDTLMAQIESALAAAALPGIKYIVPDRYMPDEDTTGAQPIVVGRQSFEVLYLTPQDNPATTL